MMASPPEGKKRHANPREVRRIKQMLIELSRIYPVYVRGKPLYQLHNQPVQQTIMAYVKA